MAHGIVGYFVLGAPFASKEDAMTRVFHSERPQKPNHRAEGKGICPSHAASKQSCMTLVVMAAARHGSIRTGQDSTENQTRCWPPLSELRCKQAKVRCQRGHMVQPRNSATAGTSFSDTKKELGPTEGYGQCLHLAVTENKVLQTHAAYGCPSTTSLVAQRQEAGEASRG